jgi:hypothetical protein
MKKKLTGDTVFAIVVPHTVNEKNTTKKMRTKTLLIAAAALVAGVISTEAQPVYSANVVGYANVILPGNGAYSLIANPFDDGNGNQLTNLLATLPNSSTVTTWNGSGYDAPISLTLGAWSGNKTLPPGVGFFVKNGKTGSPTITNTFVGSIVAANGASATNGLALGYNLVGSTLPYAGDLTTDTNLNLVVPNSSTITVWNGSGYNAPISLTLGAWSGPAPVSVGQAYFIKEGKFATNWVQTLHLQ